MESGPKCQYVEHQLPLYHLFLFTSCLFTTCSYSPAASLPLVPIHQLPLYHLFLFTSCLFTTCFSSPAASLPLVSLHQLPLYHLFLFITSCLITTCFSSPAASYHLFLFTSCLFTTCFSSSPAASLPLVSLHHLPLTTCFSSPAASLPLDSLHQLPLYHLFLFTSCLFISCLFTTCFSLPAASLPLVSLHHKLPHYHMFLFTSCHFTTCFSSSAASLPSSLPLYHLFLFITSYLFTTCFSSPVTSSLAASNPWPSLPQFRQPPPPLPLSHLCEDTHFEQRVPKHSLDDLEVKASISCDRVSLLVGCLASQLHASVSQGRICSDNWKCCHTDIKLQIKLSNSTSHSILTLANQSQCWPTPGAWQGSHRSAIFFKVTGMTRPGTIPKSQSRIEPWASAPELATLTTGPTRRWGREREIESRPSHTGG